MGNEVVIRGVNDIDVIKNRIYEVRGQRVMLDRDLAELYNVETKRLNEAVKRNIERFPEDFMFKLNKSEWEFLRSQIVTLKEGTIDTDTEDVDVIETSLRSQFATLNEGNGTMSSQIVMTTGRGQHSKYLPYAFTELGVAMLSSVLKSETAISVNREIMRAFVEFRHLAVSLPVANPNADIAQLRKDFEELKLDIEDILHDQNEINESTRMQLDNITLALAELQAGKREQKPRRKIGFIQDEEKK